MVKLFCITCIVEYLCKLIYVQLSFLLCLLSYLCSHVVLLLDSGCVASLCIDPLWDSFKYVLL